MQKKTEHTDFYLNHDLSLHIHAFEGSYGKTSSFWNISTLLGTVL